MHGSEGRAAQRCAVLTRLGDAPTIATMLTAVTGVIGSLVGAYFGIQVGNQGRQQVEARAERRRQGAEDKLNRALAVLPPEAATAVVGMDMPAGTQNEASQEGGGTNGGGQS
jgi:hypothetical protein